MVKMTCKYCGRMVENDAKGTKKAPDVCESCMVFVRFLIGMALGSLFVTVLLVLAFAAAKYLRHMG